MPRNLLRMIFALASFAVAWLIVSPASAAQAPAPLCDPRGAIMFAPPPQIQDAELSLDVPADCLEVSPFESKNVVPGRGPKIDLSSPQESVAATAGDLVPVPTGERLSIVRAGPLRLLPGFAVSVDRPPQR